MHRVSKATELCLIDNSIPLFKLSPRLHKMDIIKMNGELLCLHGKEYASITGVKECI